MRPQIAGPTLRLLAKPTPGSDMPMPTCCMFNRCDWGPGCRMASNFPADDKIHASDASNARLGEAQTHACKKYLPCGARTRDRGYVGDKSPLWRSQHAAYKHGSSKKVVPSANQLRQWEN